MPVEAGCRACGSKNLRKILSLGTTPLANSLLTEQQLVHEEQYYPLDVVFCPDCTLVQITETVPPEELFSNYFYFSSFSETMLKHSQALTQRLIQAHSLDATSLVAEIASNDGYLLQYYVHAGVPVLGIEPAQNIARVAEERGIRTLCEFFGEELGKRLAREGYRADVIHANNVLAHVADLNGVVGGIKAFLKENGVAVIEAPYVKDMIDRTEFDTIYHEHLCYFSLTALDKLFRGHGLLVSDVERISIHGGSLRIFVSHQNRPASENVAHLLSEEAGWGVDRFGFYEGFGEKVSAIRDDLRALLDDLKKQGKHIAVYGASAKGSTLLNCFSIGSDTFDFLVDRSTVKQGHYTPGTHLLIEAPEKLLERMPDYILLLSWNFADEILEQQAEYRQRGGKFIIPIPEVQVI